MPATLTKKPTAPETLSGKAARQKARLQWLQTQLRRAQTSAGPPAKRGPGKKTDAKRESLPEKPARAAASVEEELRDLIVEVLRSSPATAAQVDAQLKRVASPQTAGLDLVRQMQQAEGGAWTGAELAACFGLAPATLHRRRAEHRILFWRDAKEAFHYPKWQFTPTGALLPGVQEVLQTLRSSDEWRVMRYFLVPRQQLGGQTPLALLRREQTDKVIAHARVHGQENTW